MNIRFPVRVALSPHPLSRKYSKNSNFKIRMHFSPSAFVPKICQENMSTHQVSDKPMSIYDLIKFLSSFFFTFCIFLLNLALSGQAKIAPAFARLTLKMYVLFNFSTLQLSNSSTPLFHQHHPDHPPFSKGDHRGIRCRKTRQGLFNPSCPLPSTALRACFTKGRNTIGQVPLQLCNSSTF